MTGGFRSPMAARSRGGTRRSRATTQASSSPGRTQTVPVPFKATCKAAVSHEADGANSIRNSFQFSDGTASDCSASTFSPLTRRTIIFPEAWPRSQTEPRYTSPLQTRSGACSSPQSWPSDEIRLQRLPLSGLSVEVVTDPLPSDRQVGARLSFVLGKGRQFFVKRFPR